MATTTTPTPAPKPAPAPADKPKEHDPANELSPPYDPAKAPPYKPAAYQTDEKPADTAKDPAAKTSTTYTS